MSTVQRNTLQCSTVQCNTVTVLVTRMIRFVLMKNERNTFKEFLCFADRASQCNLSN